MPRLPAALKLSIFVGNLANSLMHDELRFPFYGKIKALRVSFVKEHETNRSRGYAFIDLGSDADVERATAGFDGLQVNGCAISVRIGRRKA